MLWLLLVLIALALVFVVPPLRRSIVTRWLMPILAGALPRMGETERIALEAGTVWWEAELFSGRPRWRKLLDFRPKALTERERFFGMIIPEEFGGLGFSALAHSAVIAKLSSRSVTAAVTAMVPNSLGPAELLLRYGT